MAELTKQLQVTTVKKRGGERMLTAISQESNVEVVGERKRVKRVSDKRAQKRAVEDNRRQEELPNTNQQEGGEKTIAVHIKSIGPLHFMLSTTNPIPRNSEISICQPPGIQGDTNTAQKN